MIFCLHYFTEMQRPRLKPGEDDLEEMARQFEAEKARAGSAGSVHPSNVVNMRRDTDKREVDDGGKPKTSLFAQKRQKKAEDGAAIRFQLPDKPDMEGDCDDGEDVTYLLMSIPCTFIVLPSTSSACTHTCGTFRAP